MTERQYHFGNATIIAPREAARIGALIADLDRVVHLLDDDIAAEEERAQVFTSADVAYPFLARTLAERRDNLRATIAMLERQLAGLHEPA
ncbi:hypothetical protein [Bradyrhizobium sp.]|uniref:hypothetical protein n=1 Tax=Bradyrhizobium sp. TaxID=376 RepID=UPI003C47D2D2